MILTGPFLSANSSFGDSFFLYRQYKASVCSWEYFFIPSPHFRLNSQGTVVPMLISIKQVDISSEGGWTERLSQPGLALLLPLTLSALTPILGRWVHLVTQAVLVIRIHGLFLKLLALEVRLSIYHTSVIRLCPGLTDSGNAIWC